MPLYEYECQSCGKRTEVLQRFAEAPLTICPHCGGELKKLLSAPAVQFKGSGWYKTDYAAKPAGKSESGEGKEKADSGKDSGKKEPATAETKAASSSSAASSSGSSGD